MSLAERLLLLRKQKGLTQMELAERLNISLQAISRWEVGAAVPSTENLKMLGEIYGVRVDYLLNDEPGVASECPDISESNPTAQEGTHNRNKYILLIACVLSIVMAVTVLICMAMARNQEQDQIVPIEDMYTGIEEDYTVGTFIIE